MDTEYLWLREWGRVLGGDESLVVSSALKLRASLRNQVKYILLVASQCSSPSGCSGNYGGGIRGGGGGGGGKKGVGRRRKREKGEGEGGGGRRRGSEHLIRIYASHSLLSPLAV